MSRGQAPKQIGVIQIANVVHVIWSVNNRENSFLEYTITVETMLIFKFIDTSLT